jgi:2-polyprenyl-3-methyl-5-hydroxy-6-metoxy-1,4-benzoquinol methylase
LNKNPSIDLWIDSLRSEVKKINPELNAIFETYAAEAKFGRLFIDDNLKQLSKGAYLLEVGAGAMILSCQLVAEGFNVSALEPAGEGFSHLSMLRELVLKKADELNCSPQLCSYPAEKLLKQEEFDFAFSINVMEHVRDVEQVIGNVVRALKVGSFYRFTCPNYLFPYEPHFNIPTLISKNLTWFCFKKIIINKKEIPDSLGLWKSLNWISVISLTNIRDNNKNIKMVFNKNLLQDSLARVLIDVEFASRRSSWVRVFSRVVVFLRVHKLFCYLPSQFLPIIDCNVQRIK